MAKRIIRSRLIVENEAEVSSHPAGYELVVHMDNGSDIDVSWLDDIDNAEILSKELNVFLAGQRGKRNVANTCLQYLRYVASVGGYVGPRSLLDYKHLLDKNKSITLNTKSQNFSLHIRFVKHLMISGVIPQDDLPRNFPSEASQPKKTFISACRYELDSFKSKYFDEIRHAMTIYSIDMGEALALVFGDMIMQKIESQAEKQCDRIMQDWSFVDSVVGSVGAEDLRKFRGVESFSLLPIKSIEIAVSILFAKFGYSIPQSRLWPKGLVDYCKRRGWPSTRLQGAFFPRVHTLDSFLVLALCNRDLMPNVDSVAFYSYTNTCVPSEHDGMTSVHFGKKRGSPLSAVLSDDSPLVVAFKALSKRILHVLPMMPGSDAILRNEFIPLMLHYSAAAGRDTVVRGLDPSTPADQVRRFIKAAAGEEEDISVLVGKVTGENFRPTHAYIRSVQGESLYSIKQKLHHAHLSTTDLYVKGVESDSSVKRKFQDFQRYILSAAREQNEKRTGSGYLCEVAKASDPDCCDYEICHECDAKRVVFDEPEIVAEWIAWKRHLLSNKKRLEMNNSERWESLWSKKLVECEAFISQTKSATLKAAKVIADNIVLPPVD